MKMETVETAEPTLADRKVLSASTQLQLILSLLIGLGFCFGLAHHWAPLSVSGRLEQWLGQPYPEWSWRNLSIVKTAALLFPALALIIWVLWRIENVSSKAAICLSLCLLALSSALLQSLGMLADYRGLRLVQDIVLSPAATSYFTDATTIQHPLDWLGHFDTATLGKHSSTHPPGPILFYYLFLKLFGLTKGALIGGCVVGLLGSAGVFVIYNFAGLWTPDCGARVTASALYALLPAMTLYFPEFDQIYPILVMLVILCWVHTLGAPSGDHRWTVCVGVIIFISTLFAYNLLAAGAFLTYYGIYWLRSRKWSRRACSRLVLTAGIAMATCGVLYAALWAVSGYNPFASFHHALVNQHFLAARLHRPYKTFVFLDLYGFLLGAGIIALPILLVKLQAPLRMTHSDRAELVLTFIGLATIITVDLSGMLRGETSRVWLFLQPLLIVPFAVKSFRLGRPWTLSIATVQWMIVVCLKARMSCLNP